MLFRDITLIDEHFEAKEHQFVATTDERVTYIGSEAPVEFDGPVYEGKNKALLPGFFNIHCHVPMTLLRGYGEGLPLQRWLTERIYPFEALQTPEDVYWGALLGCAEMLQSGAVSFTDMYTPLESVFRAVTESGMKANISNGALMFDPAGHFAPGCKDFDGMENFLQLLARAEKPDGRVRADASLHGEYTSHEAFVREVAQYAKHKGLRMHLHLSETQKEHEECKARHGGLTPAAYLEACGLLDVPATAAHCVWLEDADMDILARHGVTVASCPSSNLKLGSGIARVKELMGRGVRVGIGTDGASSNNNLNMLEEITLCSLLQKGANHDPGFMGPAQTLEMACRNGALAQGRADCGCIRVGNRADLVVYDLDKPHLHPIYDVAANILYAAQASDICLTMVDGDVAYRDGQFTHIDMEQVLYQVERIRGEKLEQLAAK